MSTLRSGRLYKVLQTAGSMSETEEHSEIPSPARKEPYESAAARMADMMQFLMEDRRKREEDIAEECRQREEQQREQERREIENERRERETQRPMDLLKGLIEGIHKQGESAEKRQTKTDVKLTKLTESDDIEAYLATF